METLKTLRNPLPTQDDQAANKLDNINNAQSDGSQLAQLVDNVGTKLAVTQNGSFPDPAPGLVVYARSDTDVLEALRVFPATKALKIAEVGYREDSKFYFANTSLINGVGVAQNLASLHNPIGNAKDMWIRRILIRSDPTAASGTEYLVKISRSNTPTGGTLLTVVKRDSDYPSNAAEVRQSPTATATGGQVFAYWPGGSAASSRVAAWPAIDFPSQREDLVLHAGESYLIHADANANVWRFSITFFWEEA